jgi:nitroreductase
MNIIEAIYSRRSIRSFKPDPVPRGVLEQLVDASRWSPSGSNTQPWEFAILGGKVLDEVKDRITQCMQSTRAHPDIPYPSMPEPYLTRQKTLHQLRETYDFPPGTENLKEKRAARRLSSGRFWDAPNAIVVYTDRRFALGLSWAWEWWRKPLRWLL